jgi:hypothetical protein
MPGVRLCLALDRGSRFIVDGLCSSPNIPLLLLCCAEVRFTNYRRAVTTQPEITRKQLHGSFIYQVDDSVVARVLRPYHQHSQHPGDDDNGQS